MLAKTIIGPDPHWVTENQIARGRGQNILIVDDELVLTGMYQVLMKTLNYNGNIMTSPAEAVRLVRASPLRFDLVITDLNMPEMDGLECSRQIRAVRADLPIILMTGYRAIVSKNQLNQSGICELIEKPVSLTVLAGSISRIFAQN